MKRVSRFKLYSWGFSVSPLTILHLTLHRREISLFLHNNQSTSHHSSFHSSHVKNEILNTLPVIADDTKEHALYHSNDSVIQFRSQNHLFVLSSSPDSEANTPSSPILFNPHPHHSIHSYPFPTEQKNPKLPSRSITRPSHVHYPNSYSTPSELTLRPIPPYTDHSPNRSTL